MESSKDKAEKDLTPKNELDRKIEGLKERREAEKEEKLEQLIIHMIVSLTLKEYYEKSDKVSKIQ